MQLHLLAHIGSWVYDPATENPKWSEEVFRIYGIGQESSAPEYKAQKKLVHPDDWEMFDKNANNAVENGIPYNFEYRICRPDKQIRTLVTICQPVLDKKGKVIVLKGTVQDITERKLIENELRKAKEKAEESERKFKLLNHLTSEMLLLPDLKSIYKFVAENLQKHYPNSIVLYVSIDESAQQTWLEVVSGLDKSLLMNILNILGYNPIGKMYKLKDLHNDYFRSGNFIEFEGGLADFSASEFPALVASAIEKLIGLHKIYTIGINKDDELLGAIHFLTFNKQVITDSSFIEVFVKQAGLVLQKKIDKNALIIAKEKAEENEEKYKNLVETASDAIYLMAEDGTTIDTNQAASAMLGRSKDEIIGSMIDSIDPNYPMAEFLKFWTSIPFNEQLIFETTHLRKDGTFVPVEISGKKFKQYENVFYYGIARDITERKQRETELLLKNIVFDSSVSANSIADTNGILTDVNNAFLNIWGYDSFDEVTGKPISKFIKNEHDAIKIVTDLNKLGYWTGEYVGIKKDGSEFSAYANASTLIDAGNNFIGYQSSVIDISDLKNTEQKLIKALSKAKESDRLKSAFLANMSHEIRTPLNSIIGFSDLLADPYFEEEQKAEFIHHIVSNGNNLLAIISDIMDISKMEAGEITIRNSLIQVNQFMEGMLYQNANECEARNLTFLLNIPQSEPEIFIQSDAERLTQIFNNLIGNAIKFTDKGTIEIGYQLVDNMVKFHVKDTGIGISPEYHKQIFERFRQIESAFTRKYGGNGLGLTLSKNLIEILGGKIWVESEVGKGSEFSFTLPRYVRPEESIGN